MRTGVILGVLGAGVLALGLGLWKMTRDEPDPIVVAGGSGKVAPPEPADAAPIAPAIPGKRDGKITPPLIVMPHDAGVAPSTNPGGGGGPELPATAPVDADIYTPRDREVKNLLRRQIVAIDQFVNECATKAAKSGAKLTGMASSKFSIRRGATAGAPNIVEVAESPDFTNVKDAQPFVDCLVQTGKRVEFDLPDGVVEVTGAQEVDLDGGAVTEHKLSAFSVKTPGSP